MIPGILAGKVKLEDAIIHTKHENLDFITAGMEVPNPSELLASDEMRLLLKSLESSYDYILIDTPPITIVSDALPLIKISDGVVLVARELTLHRKEFSKLISNLKLISANILGIIYIGTDTTHPYYHSKGYYNRYYHKNNYDKRYDKQTN